MLAHPIEESNLYQALTELGADFESKPFVPYRPFQNGDAQTLGAYLWPSRLRLRDTNADEERLFEVELGSKVLARCRWQTSRTDRPTLVIWHGMEGSSESAYMLATADKAFRAGFNVIRVNMRNCGHTEHLTPTLYHGGMSGDARAVIEELINRDGLVRIFVTGFSLGGNKVLKMAGEYGDASPPELRGVCAVSPSINLRAGCDLLMARRNWIYQKDFLYYLKRRIALKEELFPGSYSLNPLPRIRTLRQFDSTYIAPAFGFDDVDDYYAKASCQRLIPQIHIPTLIIHAQDDPFVPFGPLRDTLLQRPIEGSSSDGHTGSFDRSPLEEKSKEISIAHAPEVSIATNPNILLLAPERGGHVAFMSSKTVGEDRFWAENRVIDFCKALNRARSRSE